jgi:hypothetical protein
MPLSMITKYQAITEKELVSLLMSRILFCIKKLQNKGSASTSIREITLLHKPFN